MRELVGLVLQAGHGGGGQSVGVLGQRVQHLAVHVAAHKVADQLYLTGVVWGGGERRAEVYDRDRRERELGVGSRIRGLRMVGKGSKRKENKIQWKRDMKEKMRHADRTV